MEDGIHPRTAGGMTMVRAAEPEAREEEPESSRQRRAGIKIWRAREATSLSEITAGHSFPPGIEEGVDRRSVWAEGASAHVLYKSDRPDGPSITYIWWAPELDVYRHSHSTDCAYLLISGEVRMGRQVLTPGDGFFAPADAPYSYRAGPEGAEVIEFRPDSSSGVSMAILEDDLDRWKAMIENANAHREQWRRTPARLFPGAESAPGGKQPTAG
jgi:hypothetical protein